MITLHLNVTPTHCNEWPVIQIFHNNKTVYREKITKTQDLKFFLEPAPDNKIEIGMCDKRFGKEDIWDTESQDGKIAKDRTLTINTCTLDKIDVMDILTRNKFQVQIVDKQPIYHPTVVESVGTMWYNGTFFMHYKLPLLNDLTNQKWKKEQDHNISYFSNHTMMFHYEEEIKILKEIEEQIVKIKKKLSA